MSLGRSGLAAVDLAVGLANDSAIQTLTRATVLIAAPSASDGRPIEFHARRLREQLPQLGLFVVARSQDGMRRGFAAYARAGIDDVFVLDDTRSTERFAEVVRMRVAAPPPEQALWRTRELLGDSPMVAVAMWCIRNGHHRSTTSDAAARFGIDRTTLSRRCTASFGISPNKLLRLGSVLHFDHLQRTTSLTGQQIALRLGYESRNAIFMLRARLRRSLSPRWLELLKPLS